MNFAIRACLALACTIPLAAQAEIKIGVTTSLTGPGASIGIPTRNALSLWPTQIAGEPITLQILDDAGDPSAATKNAWRFASENVDVIVGAANTPATIAVAKVAKEVKTVQLSPSPAELLPGEDSWTFRVVMSAAFYVTGILEHMEKQGVKTVGFIGLSDAYGESHLHALQQQAPAKGIQIVGVERFSRSDNSVAGQALSLVAKRPDAILAVAVGAGAALPQKTLKERGYSGFIYHPAAAVSPDFLRLSGKDAQGALVISGPEQVPEQLPDNHPGKATAQTLVERYESQYGPGSRTQFAANAYDIGLILEAVIPNVLQKAKPGTPEFRAALRDALEQHGPITATKGLVHYTPSDHWGFGPDARVILTPEGNSWKLAQ